MCGERTPFGASVVCVYAPDTRRQYYCFQCWTVISERASADIPDLAVASVADEQMIGMMFGIRSKQKRDRIEEYGRLEMQADGVIASELDLRISMPASLMVDDVPFKRYHLVGAELEAHVARVREILGDG
jgi:hypothetical protein